MDAKILEELSALGTGGVLAAALFWFYRKDVMESQKHINERLAEILDILRQLK